MLWHAEGKTRITNGDLTLVIPRETSRDAALAELNKTEGPKRHRLPTTRLGVTHKFEIAGLEGYLNCGHYEDGQLGEVFINIAKQGSTLSGLLDTLATAVSIALQYGVPLDVLVSKFSYMKYEPNGMSENPQIGEATSISDYIFRWLGFHYLSKEEIHDLNLDRENASQSHLWVGDRYRPD